MSQGYEHKPQNQPPIAEQAVASSQLSSIEISICGAVAGLVSRFVASPLDVIKIRLQLQPGRPINPLSSSHQKVHNSGTLRKYNGMSHAIKLIIREEGIRGLWNDAKSFQTGAVCGTTATIVTYPFDLLRTRFAAQGEKRIYKGLRHAVKQIYAQEGYRGFYRGVTASVVQIIPYMGLMFGSYELLKKLFRKLEDKHIWFHNLRATEDLLSGAIAGIVSKAGVFPLDLVRKRLQVQGPNRTDYFISNVPLYSSSFMCIKEILRCDGIFGLYKGLMPALIKSAPVSAVTFFVYGYTKRLLERLHSSKDK
ncbi:mitochondrial thiamine pyrophosphate carrier 1 [Rhizophagus clarus]|uniref:Mitochondrial thiamine pyrophosphate carrier 1 n=1 Tax=Rhizophagus clarus TaxID=94130 RepID=A0A8H3R3Q1_9GLOM|nr:mitochondrial thiamine pyrophosphate carrier 1 [Rhizophagus clarus]